MFERFVVFEQAHLEIGRRYIQAFGLPRGVGAIVDDLNEGRLPWEKARYVLGHVPYLLIEHTARRVGFTRFSAVYTDPEFISLQVNSLARVLQRHGPFPPERYARALDEFAWNALRNWHLVAHDLGGRHVYEVTPSLAQSLRQPEILERPWERPRLPVPSLMLRVPPEAELTLASRGGPARVVTELYAVESSAPTHEWAVWIHAPVDEHFAGSAYVELPFSSEGGLDGGLARAQDMFHEGPPSAQGWRECVRWLAAALRYLSADVLH